MSDTVMAALIALCGTVISGVLSAYLSNKLINFRLEQLEKKVDKHNNLIDRMYKVENKVEILEKDIEHIEEEEG